MAVPNAACRAVTTACETDEGVGVCGARAAGGMDMENGPVTAAACETQSSAAYTTCRTGAGA